MSLSRRGFVQSLAAAGLGAGLASTPAHALTPVPMKASHARNVLVLVADGMNHGTLSVSEAFSRLVRDGASLHWTQLYRTPPTGFRQGLMDMASADSIVTDSAAAASSWGCGERVENGRINVTPDGRRPEPIWITAQGAGKATGLVSTARITHATPAGFAANVEDRNNEDAIAQQYLERGISLLLGGGTQHFASESRRDGQDLFAAYADQGYAVARSREALSAIPHEQQKKVLGVFWPSHLPYTIDHNHLPSYRRQVPPLSEMTRFALKHLESAPEGFCLQVEGARVDHAGHANDPGAIVWDMLEFDKAVGVALDWVQGRDDTLVILTTDHGTGGLQMNGRGARYAGSNQAFERLQRFRVSYERIAERLPAPEQLNAAEAKTLMRQLCGIELDARQADTIAEGMAQAYASDNDYGPQEFAPFFNPILYDYTGLMWTSQNHTADWIDYAAWGPGAGALGPLVRNTELHGVLLEALGLRA